MRFRFRCPVYAIVGDTRPDISPIALTREILGSGIPLVQLRLKNTANDEAVEIARRIAQLCKHSRATFIVNDRVDIAALVEADGVHLGQDDLPPAEARRILGPAAIIGHSTHNADQFAESDRNTAVDYLAYGPIFATDSKQQPEPTQGLEKLAAVADGRSKPLVAIGGIDRSNIRQVLTAGADCVAVIGAISNARDPAAETKKLLRKAKRASRHRTVRD